MKKIITLILLLSASVCFANEPTPMTTPKNGICDDFYFLIEGVCIHVTAMSNDANEMKSMVNNFKKTGKVSFPKKEEKKVVEGEDPDCTKYKTRLDKYLTEGVMGINPMTGSMQKMTGEAAASAIQNVKDNVEIFCN
jgi:hypothetical protein